MNQQQVDKLLTKLKGTLVYDDFKTVDMVVEAVIESIDLKQKIFAGDQTIVLLQQPAAHCVCMCLMLRAVLAAMSCMSKHWRTQTHEQLRLMQWGLHQLALHFVTALQANANASACAVQRGINRQSDVLFPASMMD